MTSVGLQKGEEKARSAGTQEWGHAHIQVWQSCLVCKGGAHECPCDLLLLPSLDSWSLIGYFTGFTLLRRMALWLG